MKWTQPICVKCWNWRNPQRKAQPTANGELAICCYCGDATRSGIYIRVDPRTVPYPQEDE